MISAAYHPQEEDRLAELLKYEILDTEDEHCFDELTELASTICGTSISLISLIDSKRQWFKSRVGLAASETHRDLAFCAHAIHQDDIFEIQNALEDERFVDNPLVTGPPDIRFYAGKPLITASGLPIGTLCVIDTKPNKLNENQKKALNTLAKQVISQLELRLHTRKMQRMNAEREQFYGILAHDLKSPFNVVIGLSRMLVDSSEHFDAERIISYAKEIFNSSLKIYQILDEILQWTEHCMSSPEIILEPINVRDCVDNSLSLLSESIKAKDINLHINVPEKVTALASSTLLKTVLRNLLSNAIKYSLHNGLINIEANMNENQTHLVITDDGQGIPDSIKQQLFKKVVMSTEGTLGEAGHGLGLHLTHKMVLMQKGKIWLDETHSPGTKIHCTFANT
ncbi:MAG: ATP-binding protein [Oleiphilus sp.]